LAQVVEVDPLINLAMEHVLQIQEHQEALQELVQMLLLMVEVVGFKEIVHLTLEQHLDLVVLDLLVEVMEMQKLVEILGQMQL
jgi:hypothetical protein